jgi:hypothetical protein
LRALCHVAFCFLLPHCVSHVVTPPSDHGLSAEILHTLSSSPLLRFSPLQSKGDVIALSDNTTGL